MKKRKKVSCTWVFAFLLISLVIARETPPGPKPLGPADDFKLTVEPAWVARGEPNVDSKSELARKLFPDRNSIVEFFYDDSPRCCHGFRVDTISTNNYIMEVAWVTGFTGDFAIERIEIPVSTGLASRLWETYHFIMKFYTSKGIAPAIPGGYLVAFRCVVEDFSVWTFSARSPLTHIKDLAKTCNQIVEEVRENGKITDEEKYVKQINDYHTEVFFNRRDPRVPGMELELDSVQVIRFGR